MQRAAPMKQDGGDDLRQTTSLTEESNQGGMASSALSPIPGFGLVPDEGAADFFGVSKRTFGTFMGADWMPQPIILGPRLRRWSLDELRAAVAKMPRQAGRVQPESLLRARIERMKSTGATA